MSVHNGASTTDARRWNCAGTQAQAANETEQGGMMGGPFFFKQGSALRPRQDDLLDGVEVKE